MHLAAIHPDAEDGHVAPLEAIYVDPPTEYRLYAQVVDTEITDWWIVPSVDEDVYEAGIQMNWPDEHLIRSEELKWHEREGLEELIAAQHDYRASRAEVDRDRAEKRYVSGHIDDGVYTVREPLTATQIAGACRRLVALGAPGSGKSTFVKHLALCLAGEALEDRRRAIDLKRLFGWRHGVLTPVYVELRRFVASAHFPADLEENHRWTEHLWNYIRAEILGVSLAEYAPYLETALRDGSALLILDGLDEISYPAGRGNLARRQRQIRALAASLDDHFEASRIVVASRPYAYKNWRLADYRTLWIAPFGNVHRKTLAANLFRVSGAAAPERKADRFDEALGRQGIALELADNPLFITLMATLFARNIRDGALPTRKGTLYRESVLLLLERWTQAKPEGTTLAGLLGYCSQDELLARLAKLAYKVHSQYGVGHSEQLPEVPADLLFSELFQLQRDDPTVDAQGLMAYLSESAGLLVSPGHRQDDPVFHFAHRTFQEYLAAVHLVDVCCRDSYAPVRMHITRDFALWRVPCLLTADHLRDTEREGDAMAYLRGLIEDLLSAGEPGKSLAASDSGWWSVWLAACIVEEQGLFERTHRLYRSIRDTLQPWLLQLFETAGALLPPERAHCGRVLSLLGDSRLGVGTETYRDVALPKIAWVTVPDDGEWLYQKEHQPGLAAFRISRYPVTYAQFQCFLDDPEGYRNSARWFEGLAANTRDVKMDDQTFPYDNHPRERVNWYQAVAFCRWLSWRLDGVYSLDRVLEWTVRLPTELEWEKAARGRSGLVYPYGDEFDVLKGNTGEIDIGQTTAVGLFPDGISPYGVDDMSGNVWEWCLTACEDGSNEVTDKAPRVLRGGSWDDLAIRVRADMRYYNHPDLRDYGLGFRVASLFH